LLRKQSYLSLFKYRNIVKGYLRCSKQNGRGLLIAKVRGVHVGVWYHKFVYSIVYQWARGSVVGRDTMAQARRSRVPFPMRSLNFFNVLDPSNCTVALGFTQPVIDVSTRKSSGSTRPARKADNLTAVCGQIV
jgi:hypothetical protein